MKRLLWLLLVLPFAVTAYANESAQGWCERGAVKPVTQGLNSATNTQGSYPQCTVTVYNSGTVTPATIYSDNATPPTAIPGGSFTASTLGHWQFYGANGIYDVVLSGSGFPSPLTLRAVSIGSVTLDCAKYPGANAGVKIANCIAGLPSTGGTADARSITGTQAITSDFFSGVTKPGTLILGAGTFTTSVCLNVPTNWTVRGTQGDTIILGSAATCGLGGANQNHTGINISDVTIRGAGVATYGIDLSNSATGADCVNHIGPNVVIENVATAGVRMTNCGGSDTWIKETLIRQLAGSAICIDWSNPGGNTLIDKVACDATKGAIKASGQMVIVSDSSFAGFIGADQIPVLVLSNNYLYPGANHVGVIPKTGANINSLTIIGGLFTGQTVGDSYVDGVYGAVNLIGTIAASPSPSNFFGSTFAGIGGGNTLEINAAGIDLVWGGGGQVVTWNPPSVATAAVSNRHINQNGGSISYFQGPFSIGATPSGTGANRLELHSADTDATFLLDNTSGGQSQWYFDATATNSLGLVNNKNAGGTFTITPGATVLSTIGEVKINKSKLTVTTAGNDAFIVLDNTNASPSQYVLDASNGDLLKIYNNRATAGNIQLDPGTTASGATVSIAQGYFVPPAVVFASLATPSNGRTTMCSDCKNVGDGVTAGAICVNGGTGAFAIRESGNWRCF